MWSGLWWLSVALPRIEHVDDNRGQAGEALDAVRTALDALADVGPWRASDAEVAALVVQAETFARRLAGVQLASIAEGVNRGLPFSHGAGTGRAAPGRWVRSLIAVTPGDAARRADLAGALFTTTGPGPGATELTPTRNAVLAGRVSTAHATHIVDAIEQLLPPHTPAGVVDDATRAEAQALLLACAAGGTGPDGTHAPLDPTQVAKAAIALTATLDPGHGDRLAKDEDAQHQLRTFTITPLPSGMCHAAGLLTKTAGHALIGVLQSLSAPQPAADGTPDPRTAGMRTHDGLEAAARLLQGQTVLGSGGLLPGAHGSPNRLVVSVDIHTLAAHLGLGQTQPSSDAPLRVPELPGRWPLSPLAAQVMSCDADLVAVLTGPDGTPLDVADTSYPFTTKQRTAIINRDKHCTYATCTAPAPWCHVHHLNAFSRGGPTTITNAALLCGVHHRHVHTHHLTGTRTTTSSSTVIWQAPTGTHPNPHLPPVAVAAAITALATRWHRRQQREQRTRAPAADQDTG